MSQVLINTEPPGAEVYVDGVYLGQSPVQYADNAIAGTAHRVEVRMEGYHPTFAEFRRNANVNPGALIGGFCCFPVWLWVVDYPRAVIYPLRPLEAERSPRERQGAGPAEQPPAKEPILAPPPPPPDDERAPVSEEEAVDRGAEPAPVGPQS